MPPLHLHITFSLMEYTSSEIMKMALSMPIKDEVLSSYPYREEMENIAYAEGIFRSCPCRAWRTVLLLSEKYSSELSALGRYYNNSKVYILPDILVTSALIISDLYKLSFIIPRCIYLREMRKNS